MEWSKNDYNEQIPSNTMLTALIVLLNRRRRVLRQTIPLLLFVVGFLSPTLYSATLVPVYGTYFGGTGDTNSAVAVALDSSGNVIEAGITSSQTLPGTANAFQPMKAVGFPDNQNVYIAKFNPTGQVLLWATFLGGDQDDRPISVAVDTSGNVYVVGVTSSSTFPVTPGAYLGSANGGGFASKISADGNIRPICRVVRMLYRFPARAKLTWWELFQLQ
jgi:hypothetical protein